VGLEPTTRGLKGRCSNQLSYGPTLESQLIGTFVALEQRDYTLLPLLAQIQNKFVIITINEQTSLYADNVDYVGPS
jgi:hypothetical protein